MVIAIVTIRRRRRRRRRRRVIVRIIITTQFGKHKLAFTRVCLSDFCPAWAHLQLLRRYNSSPFSFAPMSACAASNTGWCGGGTRWVPSAATMISCGSCICVCWWVGKMHGGHVYTMCVSRSAAQGLQKNTCFAKHAQTISFQTRKSKVFDRSGRHHELSREKLNIFGMRVPDFRAI